MQQRLVSTVAVVLAVLALAGGASSLSSLSDPAGDAGGAPDVTAVSVDNDANGNVTIAITTNQAQLASDAILILSIDSDRNRTTGSPAGVEYSFTYRSTGSSLAVWNGSMFAPAPSTTVHTSYTSGVLRFEVDKSELGNTTGFAFSVISSQLAGNQAVATDLAPDSGTYTYVLKAPTIVLRKAAVKAPGIHAGKPFAISARAETTAATPKVACVARIGRRVIRVTGRYAAGTATCAGTVPRGTAGRRLAGTLTASIGGAKAASRFSFVIRK